MLRVGAVLLAGLALTGDFALAEQRSRCIEGSPARLEMEDGRVVTMRLISITRKGDQVDSSPTRCNTQVQAPLSDQNFTLLLPVAARDVWVSLVCGTGHGPYDDAWIGSGRDLVWSAPTRWTGFFPSRKDLSLPACHMIFVAKSRRGRTERRYWAWW
jgi:hypothetical protein